MEDFSFDIAAETVKISKKWKDKFEKDELSVADFEEHWKLWVPRIYTPGLNRDCLTWNFNEEFANYVLYKPILHFICDGDPEVVLAALCEEDKPASVCSRVFKMGEPTYSCRECGMDNTCVLCVECFRGSEHKNHKYKMATSPGGGCCDCGDIEAWKKDPYCENHMVRANGPKDKGISKVFKDRARIAFDAILWYAFRSLTSEQVSDIRFCKTSDRLFDLDMYCTILYNDEVHTFEQVISTLSRVLKCNQRSAIAFVTNIDREGRAVVKCSDFQHCNELRTEIEKYTSRHGNKPLKVIVSHAYIIAHQLFAMRLLACLQEFLGKGEAFRSTFSEVALKIQGVDLCIIKGVLLRDSTLWKSARTHWHRLFISGMLPEYENKKALAKIFTKNYGHVMKDFIRDDHDHSYSIASLSVQLFTTPSIALHLIAHEDIFYLLLNSFISECTQKCNKAGKLEFERNPTSAAFKRAQHMLYDLKYLLSFVPYQWTDELRRSFLHGLNGLFTLLTMMQGMDSTTRQIGQHMEYEPEWESAFNLHIKLSYCISSALKWCGSDRVVLIKAYRAVLKCLVENPCFDPSEPCEVRELADHSTACLHYDVSTKPVSIHLPLTRFLVGLHLHLEKFNLGFDSTEFQGVNKPTPVEIIEPVLRTQVLVAQVHAGMWRRNGYGLLNQLFFYQNVKFRSEMFDRDITALQIGASLIESNEFLIHCLNKYNLINWANSDFEISSLKSSEEEGMRQTINLVEEFLQLLIAIIGERHMPGLSDVTAEERVKKEIIQNLCIKPLLHSELTKNIPEEIISEIEVDDIINELADFKRGQGSAKGVYELKSEYYDEYNIFYYHYSKEELSKSEENQRKIRAAAGKLECCPPPQLPKLNDPFSLIVNLLQCDVMLHIMQTILDRCSNLRARSYSELQLHKILHLIGYALQEEQTNFYPFFKFVENSNKFKILQLLESLLTCPRVDAHKDLLRWTINEYKKVANQVDNKNTVTYKDSSEELAKNEKEKRAKLAAKRRANIMEQMAAMQKNFMKENAQLFEETNSDLSLASKSYYGSAMDITEATEQQIALGIRQSTRTSVEKSYTCILCQEEEVVRPDGPVMVLAAFVQESTVLCQNKCTYALGSSVQDPLYLHANLGPSPHTNTCGHAMHGKCWEQYYDHVTGREHRRPYRLRHPASFDVDKQEYLCPLCECLSNTALPIVPPLSVLQPESNKTDMSFDNFMKSLKVILSKKIKYCHGNFICDKMCKNEHCEVCVKASKTVVDPLIDNCEAQWVSLPHNVFYSLNLSEVSTDLGVNYEKLCSMLSTKGATLDISLLRMIESFAMVPFSRGLHIYPQLSTKKQLVDGRINPMAWKSLTYTIHSIEMLLRDSNKPLLGQLSSRQRDGIECFVKLNAVLGCNPRSTVNKCHALELLSILIEHDVKDPSILQWDSFGFLVALTFSLPSLSLNKIDIPAEHLTVPLPTGGTLESHILRLIFAAHIVRIIILLNPTEEERDSMETDSHEGNIIAHILSLIKREQFSSQSALKKIRENSIPFLRCCVLFYHYLTEVPAPPSLLEVGGDTFSNMCAYLNLPENPEDVFDCEIIQLLDKWCHHKKVQSYLTGTETDVVKEPLKVNRLIELPEDYSDLINTVSSFTCPKSDHEDARNPTMCLVCGDILCSQSYCCQTDMNKILVGACNYHAHTCGAGFGIFLRVRDCEILLLASPHRGCFMSAPYLDDYGETDQGLKRGNPLKLCRERYKKLQLLWSSHGILEEIARALESSSHIVGATQWHHL
ncbi:hypothetical protein WA026_019159 [Henosepilachna vigintioctopunctata]